jgi:hypothetical protein
MFRKNTDAIIAPLNKILRKLDKQIDFQTGSAMHKRERARSLTTEASNHDFEADRANRIREKVASLID